MSLGERLQQERYKRNWSQKYVGEKIGITNTVLSNYERDYREPDIDTLLKLSNLFEVSTDYLLDRAIYVKIDGFKGTPNINLTYDEMILIDELRKEPILLKQLVTNPNKEVRELVKWIEFKNDLFGDMKIIETK